MSFKSIIKKVWDVVQAVEQPAAEILKQIPTLSGPATLIDGIFDRLQATIQQVEVSPVVGGELKSGIVIKDFENGLGVAQSILALQGMELQYDKFQLQQAIDHQVAAYNAMAKVKAP